jgi:molybdate transport system permease protein
MLGGNIVGRTNTMSLEIYNAVFNGEYPKAIALSAALGIVSLVIFVLLRRTARSVAS